MTGSTSLDTGEQSLKLILFRRERRTYGSSLDIFPGPGRDSKSSISYADQSRLFKGHNKQNLFRITHFFSAAIVIDH